MKRILFLLIFIIHRLLVAQEPYYINYSINDGLPSNTIYSIVNDNRGFLWFTTDIGIVKYDSKNFMLINTDDGLSDNEVFQMKEDSKGRKWLLTFNGIPTFIYKDTIYTESNSELIRKIKGKSMLTNFYEDDKANLYLSFLKEEVIAVKNNDSVFKYYINNANIAGSWSSNEQLFSLTSKGIYNTTKNKLHEPLDSKSSLRLYHQKNDVFYSNGSILNTINSENKSDKLFELSINTEIINIYKETQNIIWVCTRNGLFKFENNIQKRHFFKDYIISRITKDIEGNYWVSTLGNGLLFVPSFEVFQKNIKINCIAKKEQNTLWFGGFENDYYVKTNNTFSKKSLNINWRKNSITNIRFFENTTYVIGKSGLLKINPTNTQEFPININDVMQNNNHLFIASTNTFKIGKNELSNDLFSKNKSKVILNKRSLVFANDSKHNVWIGTNIGLFKYNFKDSIKSINNKKKVLSSLVNDLFFDDENKHLIIATASKGLVVIKNDTISHTISQKDNFNSNTVNTIEKLNSNTYLIGTNNGLNLLNLKDDTFTIKNYNTALSFKNKKVNAIAFVNDTIYIATNDKLIYFKSNYLKNKTTKPICFIDGLYIKNKTKNVISGSKIEYNSNDININFTGISFIDKGDITYHYKLNNNWSTTKETQRNYNTLTPNNYTFSVYCVNGFGQKSDTKSISFTILKPFWKQWWFIMLEIISLIAIVLILWRLRVNYLNRQFEKERKAMLLKNQMLALEQKALRLQMNPHFIFNALNSIKGYYSIGDANKANNYIEKFSKLLRMLLEIEDQTTTLENEIEMLTLYLDLNKIRYKNKFDYQINTPSTLHTNSIVFPTLLLQPLVENAIIHGLAPKKEKGLLQVSFSKSNSILTCIVYDNGIGREASSKIKKESEHESKALTITKERLLLFDKNATIQFEDLKENSNILGTKVIIKIRLKSIW